MTAAPDAKSDGGPMKLSYVRLNRYINTWGQGAAVESKPLQFKLHPQTLSLQLVKTPTDEQRHAAANVLIYVEDGKVKYEDMSRQGMSMHDVKREAVPDEPAKPAFDANELSGKVTDIELVHFTDDESVAKGRRQLKVTWQLAIKGADIEQRLQGSVDEAQAELERAEAEVSSASDSAEEAKAKAAVAKAKAAKRAAESRYSSGLSRERSRLARLFKCADVKLATTSELLRPSNRKQVTAQCKVLKEGDSVEVTMHYTLGRYELPVALVYSLGRDEKHFDAIASKKLSQLDAR